MSPNYHSVYSEHIGHRPRRRLCLGPFALVPAGLLGALAGGALTSAWLGTREPVAQHAVCVIRGVDSSFIRTGVAGLTGWCELRR